MRVICDENSERTDKQNVKRNKKLFKFLCDVEMCWLSDRGCTIHKMFGHSHKKFFLFIHNPLNDNS